MATPRVIYFTGSQIPIRVLKLIYDNKMLEFSKNQFLDKMTTEEYICTDKGFKGLDRHHKNICPPFFSKAKENEKKR